MYIAQADRRLKDKAAAKAVRAREAHTNREAAEAKTETALVSMSGSLRKRGGSHDVAPAAKEAKVEVPVPSAMSIAEKDALWLTILLVRETQHLLRYGLSDALIGGNSLNKKFIEDDSAYFTDVGHLMERTLYGYYINHVCNAHFMTPFGVDEIVGSVHQNGVLRYILQPVPDFLQLLRNPECTLDIIAETMRLAITSSVEYKATKKTIRLGRATERRGDHSPEGSPKHRLFGVSFSQSTESAGEDTDEELEPTITKGKA